MKHELRTDCFDRFAISIILMSLVLCSGLHAMAAGQSQATPVQVSPFHMGFQLRGDSSSHRASDVDHAADSSLWLAPGYKLSDVFSMSGLLIVSKDFKGEQKWSHSDAMITVRKKAQSISKIIKFSPALLTKLPVSKKSNRIEGLKVALKGSTRFLIDLAPLKIKGLNRLSGFYDLGIYQNFHGFKTALNGRSNTRNSWVNWFDLSYSFTNKLSMNSTFIYTYALSYEGNSKGSFDIENSLIYRFNPALGLSLGISNSGNVYKANGVSSNLAIYNPNSSTVFSSLSLKI